VLALGLLAQPVFAQRGGGGHGGGGGGFHGGGGGFHGGSVGGFHGGGGFSGTGHFGGGYRGGYGYGWRGGYGGRGWGYGRYGWGWGWGLGLGWGWPWWGYPYGYDYYPGYYSYPYDPNYCPPGYTCTYNGNDDPPPPPNNRPNSGYYPATPWRPSAPEDADASDYANQTDAYRSQAPILSVDHITATPPSSNYHVAQTASLTKQEEASLSPQLRNALHHLREMPPFAREREIDTGRYSHFSTKDKDLLRRAG